LQTLGIDLYSSSWRQVC